MNILFLGWGGAVPLAMICRDQGHDIRYWIREEDDQDIGDGFVPKVKDYKESLKWADLVITDYTAMGKINDAIRAKGIPVIGGTEMTDALEEDRHLGQRLFKSVGLNAPESNEFKKIEEAVAFIQDNPKRYVVKVSGTAQNDKSTTYVGEADDGSDAIAVLEHMGHKIGGKIDAVEIQEKIEGMEVAVSAFFNGQEFIGPCQVNFEHKKLMPGPSAAGWGPNTSEMGTTGLWCERSIGLFKQLLAPFAKPLKSMGYHGDFDVNAILAEDGKLYPLEMTNRFGWPALALQLETIKENDLGEFFLALASGKDFELTTSYPLSLCVVVGVPPLPYTNDEVYEKYSKDMPVLFRDGEPQDGMYPGECKLVDGQWIVAGSTGCLAVCAAGGHTIEECSEAAYALAGQIIVPNKFVRNDIGKYTEESLSKLQDLNLISDLEQEAKA